MSGSTGEIVWVVLGSALLSAALVVLLRPVLIRFASVYPNVRSSHRSPTPQGGGIAVIAATIMGLILVNRFGSIPTNSTIQLVGLLFSAVGLAIVGTADDLRPIAALPRLFFQIILVFAVVATLPIELRIIPTLPWAVERFLILLGLLWFINLTNFMDGIDWMTVAEFLPITGGLIVAGLLDALPAPGLALSATLCGAVIGFAPFNRPAASLFLGDVGSLSLGLVLGWLLVLLASAGHLTAALLMPLYYLADATITLARRAINGEPLMVAHRGHFYQRAVDRGVNVLRVVGLVFLANFALVALSLFAILIPGSLIRALTTLLAIFLVGGLLFFFEKGPIRP